MDPRIRRARDIIECEAHAVRQVAERLDEGFARVVERVLSLRGRVVTSGMGKAGIIAQKVSATLASTGTPSIFLHPAEAIHGDLGRVENGDLLLAFSKSGETQELLIMLPHVKSVSVPIVGVTQRASSTLGRHCDEVIELGEIEEAGHLALAPSASTTAMLALGDALALVVQEGRRFGPEDFARFHPGGDLGRKLMRVGELMRAGPRNPVVPSGSSLLVAIEVMTRTPGRPGATSVVDEDGALLGFFTDGDLRRLIERGLSDPANTPIDGVMTRNPRTISTETFALEALALLHQYSIDQMPVVDARNRLVGLLDVQDLLNLKIG
ncbi:MAG: KpsF/GutQ family sugar-phosphate isomerase [Planctomycetota bacterium]